jgi:hypothetical protein
MTTPGDFKGAYATMVAPDGPNRREVHSYVSRSPTMMYRYIIQNSSMNSRMNSRRIIPNGSDTDWSVRTLRPFPIGRFVRFVHFGRNRFDL